VDGQTIVAIIAAVGGGALVPEIIRAVRTAVTGRAAKERDAVSMERARADQERARADRADARADMEATNRRRTAEYASSLRRMLVENGIQTDEIPGWPEATKTIPHPSKE